MPAQQDKLVLHNSTKDMLTIKIHHFGFFNKYFSMTKPSPKSLLNGTFFWIKETLLFRKIYMLFTGREGRIGKNCAGGLEYGPRPQAEGRTRDRGHSFSQYGPTKAGE